MTVCTKILQNWTFYPKHGMHVLPMRSIGRYKHGARGKYHELCAKNCGWPAHLVSPTSRHTGKLTYNPARTGTERNSGSGTHAHACACTQYSTRERRSTHVVYVRMISTFFYRFSGRLSRTNLDQKWYDHGRTGRTVCDASAGSHEDLLDRTDGENVASVNPAATELSLLVLIL